jgi:uncharacterized membrane protein (DUF485 family)
MRDEPEAMRITEFRELRATIRQRGSLRLTITSITFSVWAVAILMVSGWLQTPIVGLVPLVVLAAGFELIFGIHTSVERIGRYIQVHHEPSSGGGARWEQTAMRLHAGGASTHPLLPTLHVAAAILNFALAALVAGDPEYPEVFPTDPDMLIYASLHILFIGRVLWAFRSAAAQRARDLAMFSDLLGASPRDPNP